MTDVVTFDRFDPTGTRYALLPIRRGRPVYRARCRTAEAILQPADGEVRISAVERDEKGDFAALMDAIVRELGENRVRFVGARHPDDGEAADEAWAKLSPDDARPLYDVLDGFEFETMTYQLPSGETEPTDTLVGEWSP